MPYDTFRRRLALIAGALLLASFLLALPEFAAAQNASQKWNDAVNTLVEKIAGMMDTSQPASVEVNNISSLQAVDVSAVEGELQTELAKHVHLAPQAQAKTRIVVTLSEGTSGYVWVAQVQSGSSQQTAMASIPKEATVARREQPAMTLQRKIMWSQAQPFLDFALVDSGSTNKPPEPQQQMIVLEPTRIVFHSSQNGKWVAGKSIPLNPAATLPRDVRGMIWQAAGEIEMLIPGESCSGEIASLPELSCASYPSTNPEMNWPLVTGSAQREDGEFQSNRNFFGGVASLAGGNQSNLPPFYSAAAKPTKGGLDWLMTGRDGKARLYDSSETLVATFSGWGDQVVTINTACDDSWQVLATGTGDSAQPDHIEIYDIRNYPESQNATKPLSPQERLPAPQGIAVGQPLDFAGPILALWSAEDQKSARAVSLNLQTGMYEGSILTVSCGH